MIAEYDLGGGATAFAAQAAAKRRYSSDFTAMGNFKF
jgi:hypothetical protein